MHSANGVLAQLVERLNGIQKVSGSIPLCSTNTLILRHVIKTIYLAAGCFWGAEHYFKQIRGIVSTEAGFANGNIFHPTYAEVATDCTGYAETVKVDYDTEYIGLERVLQFYFKAIDPLSVNRQGNDTGVRYRTGIYYTDEADLVSIRKIYDLVAGELKQPLAVEVKPLKNFYKAEAAHQDYLDKHPDGYCHISKNVMEFARSASDPSND